MKLVHEPTVRNPQDPDCSRTGQGVGTLDYIWSKGDSTRDATNRNPRWRMQSRGVELTMEVTIEQKWGLGAKSTNGGFWGR